MPLHVRTGTGFRWRPTALHGEARDVVRCFDEDGVRLALMANGYECGFSVCWPPASRLILDLFVEAWGETDGPIRDRLCSAFERARERFATQAPALITPDADFPEDLPSAVLLVVAIEGARIHMAWIGGDVALVARGFDAVAETSPHTLVERFRREHGEAVDLSAVPNVVVRSIAAGQREPAPFDYRFIDAAAGDTVVLLSRAAFDGPGVAIGDAAFAAAAYASPAMLADRLAEVAFADSRTPYAAVAVLRLDDVDVASTIDRLVDAYDPNPRHGEWLRDWSVMHRALPVVYDMGGVLAMRRDGSILGVRWDDPTGPTQEETSGIAHLAAVVGAAQRYAELATLAPRAPRDAEACSQCAVPYPGGRRGCPACWHLGWTAPGAPTWFFDALPRRTPSHADVPATATKLPWWKRVLRRSS